MITASAQKVAIPELRAMKTFDHTVKDYKMIQCQPISLGPKPITMCSNMRFNQILTSWSLKISIKNVKLLKYVFLLLIKPKWFDLAQ